MFAQIEKSDSRLVSRTCGNPKCSKGKYFLTDNLRRKYCSASCRSRASQLRAEGRLDDNISDENNEKLLNNENFENMESQLLAEVRKNSELQMELKLLERDHKDLKEKFETLKKREIDSGKLEYENDRLKKEIEDLRAEIDLATDENGSASEEVEKLEKKLVKSEIIRLGYQCLYTRQPLQFNDVKKVANEVKLNEADSFKSGRLTITRDAGATKYVIKYL